MNCATRLKYNSCLLDADSICCLKLEFAYGAAERDRKGRSLVREMRGSRKAGFIYICVYVKLIYIRVVSDRCVSILFKPEIISLFVRPFRKQNHELSDEIKACSRNSLFPHGTNCIR